MPALQIDKGAWSREQVKGWDRFKGGAKLTRVCFSTNHWVGLEEDRVEVKVCPGLSLERLTQGSG